MAEWKKSDGETYTVKYLGVVSGTMGILSRKMRMQKAYEDFGNWEGNKEEESIDVTEKGKTEKEV